MNKTDLVAAVAEKTGLPHAQAAGAVDGTIEALVEGLRRNEDFSVPGFGDFPAEADAEEVDPAEFERLLKRALQALRRANRLADQTIRESRADRVRIRANAVEIDRRLAKLDRSIAELIAGDDLDRPTTRRAG